MYLNMPSFFLFFNFTDCTESKSDIVFVLDSSGSVGEDNFKVMKDFVKSVVQNLNIGPDNTKVGVITFSRYPVIRLHLDDYTDKTALLQAIDQVPYIAGIYTTFLCKKITSKLPTAISICPLSILNPQEIFKLIALS